MKWLNGLGFSGGSDGKGFTCNAGDQGSIPVWGRSPGEGNGHPLQYSLDRGAHEVAKSQTWLSDCHTFFLRELGISRRHLGLVLKSRDPAVQEPWNLVLGQATSLLATLCLTQATSSTLYVLKASIGSVTIRESNLHWLWCYLGTEPDLPCGPVVKTLPFQCRGYRFNPWSGEFCCAVWLPPPKKKQKAVRTRPSTITIIWAFKL